MGKMNPGRSKHYDQPLVPEQLTKQTIETLPFDTVYYVSPGERDDYEAPAIFVTPDRRLHMSTLHAIDMDDTDPTTPLQLVGVMKSVIIDSKTETLREVTLADLRFIENDALVDIDPTRHADDQEEMMGFMRDIEESTVFDGIIVSERDTEVTKDGKIEGYFCADESLHPILEVLMARGDKLMSKQMKRLKKQKAKRKLAKASLDNAGNIDTAQKEPTKSPHLSVSFSHGN